MGCGCSKKSSVNPYRMSKPNRATTSGRKKRNKKNNERIGKLSGLVRASKKPRKSRK